MTKRLNLKFDRLSGVYLLVVFIVVFGALRPDTFLTMDTVHLLASGQALNGLVAIAVLIPTICGQFDLSVGANANLVAMVAVQLQVEKGISVVPAVAVAVVLGIAIGIANGFIVVKLGVSSFIATLGMASVLTAFQTMVTKSELPPVPESSLWSAITQKEVFGFQVVFLYLVVAVGIAWWVLEYTPVGRYMMATGSNVEAARLSGVRTDVWSWTSFVAAGGISAVAGVLYVSLTGPSVSFGNSLVLPAFAAVFLGSTQLKPGRFNILGTVLAIFVLATGVLGLQLLTSISWINDMFNGIAVIAAVALAVARRPGARPRLRRRRTAAATQQALAAKY
ncbi:ribose transport system permease protein [Amycolatopsis sacchari]|uniref:Ribose transport system permease protein n=1 Tax=Amycolatopsis sacchari TaxID=115433 RepID=A0A1I3WLM2_9PSEU|nr:ABC transporter permease [Amycolatopsis sacchari]SFK07366.1 ribose transport system permease protein [Amycolatopsis sacchari]